MLDLPLTPALGGKSQTQAALAAICSKAAGVSDLVFAFTRSLVVLRNQHYSTGLGKWQFHPELPKTYSVSIQCLRRRHRSPFL